MKITSHRANYKNLVAKTHKVSQHYIGNVYDKEELDIEFEMDGRRYIMRLDRDEAKRLAESITDFLVYGDEK